MVSKQNNWDISKYVAKMESGKIKLDHILQREADRWNKKQKIKLIDSIVRGYPIPALYATTENDNPLLISILDGKQRLTAIKDFITDQSFKYDGQKFDEMSEDLKQRILDTEIPCIVFEDCSSDEIIEIFSRFNNGTHLSKAEKSKAVMGNDMIIGLNQVIIGEKNNHFFDKTGMTKAQKKKSECYDVLTQSLMLIKNGVSDFSFETCVAFLEENRDAITQEDYDELDFILTNLGEMIDRMTLPKKNPITKVSIPPIVAVMRTLTEEQYPAFEENLKNFFENYDNQTEYHEACKKSTDKASVEKRLDIFKSMVGTVTEVTESQMLPI